VRGTGVMARPLRILSLLIIPDLDIVHPSDFHFGLSFMRRDP